MRGLSISLRLAAWYAGISVAGFAIFGVAMWFVLANSMISWKDRTLQMRATRVEAVLANSPVGTRSALNARLDDVVGVLPEGELIQVVRANGERLFPKDRFLPAPDLPGGACAVSFVRDHVFGRENFRQLCYPAAYMGETVFVVAPSSLMEDRILLRNFTQGLYRTIPFILLVSGLGGYLLSRRALKPVDVLIAEARTIMPNDLSRRLTVSAPDDQLRRLAMEWNNLLARIDSAMIRVTQFTADASHELRNPIAYIRTTAEYSLGGQLADEESREAFRVIAEEAKITSGLLEDLLTLARLDLPSPVLHLEQVDIHATTAEIATNFSVLVKNKGQTLRVQGFGGLRPTVAMNAIHFRRVVTAILDNAIKYTPEAGLITITCDVHEGVNVRVTDTGMGIAQEHLERIFDRFYRVDQVRSEMSEGVGLGLPIAKLLTELYGGKILVESQLSKGTTFTLRFPG